MPSLTRQWLAVTGPAARACWRRQRALQRMVFGAIPSEPAIRSAAIRPGNLCRSSFCPCCFLFDRGACSYPTCFQDQSCGSLAGGLRSGRLVASHKLGILAARRGSSIKLQLIPVVESGTVSRCRRFCQVWRNHLSSFPAFKRITGNIEVIHVDE